MAFLTWEEANPFGIALDDTGETWHAGEVIDLLAIGRSVVVVSRYGSAWIINPGLEGTPTEDRYRANCISDESMLGRVNTLAFGPDGQTQLFLAAYSEIAGSVIYAVTLAISPGQVDFVQSVPLTIPSEVGQIYEIVVASNPRRIIVLTSAGVFWSAIPSVFDQPSGYFWQAASDLPQVWSINSFQYSALALGPGTSIVLGIPGPTTQLSSPPSTGPFGFFVGNWNAQQTDLQFTQAVVSTTSFNAGRVANISIDSCRGDRNTLYALCTDWLGYRIYTVLLSHDGGQHWSTANGPANLIVSDNLLPHNRVIAVSPDNPLAVVLCWRDGPFLSTDGGISWELIQGNGLTTEQHAAYFLDLPSHQLAFFVGGVGGVSLVSQDLASLVPIYGVMSTYNMHLRNHAIDWEFGSPGPAIPTSRSYQGLSMGLMSIGYPLPASVASSQADPTAPVAAQPWRLYDPQYADQFMISTGQVVVAGYGASRLSTWNPQLSRYSDWPGVIIPLDGSSDGLNVRHVFNSSAFAPVFSPTYTINNQRLFAIAGNDQKLYGLFGDSTGANMHWTLITETPAPISAVASRDGSAILVATNDGEFSICDAGGGSPNPMPRTQAVATSGHAAMRVVIQSDLVMFAMAGGKILRYLGNAWEFMPGSPPPFSSGGFNGLETDWTGISTTVYMVAGGVLYGSQDNGENWSVEVQGLPAAFDTTNFWFAHEPNGERTLYLSTQGRSLWRARITAKGEIPALPSHIGRLVRILWGVIQDGGGLTSGGPISPWGVDEELLVGILAADLAQTLPGSFGALRSTATLRVLALRAQQLLEAESSQRRGWLARFFSRGRQSQVSVQTLLRDITRLSGEISDLQAITVAVLAASLSRKQGNAKGVRNRQKALRFVQQHAQSAAENVRLRQNHK